ncbi:hypothetical protein QJS10_CPB12g00916 [Acorus calamus]|uniref:Uncharacterized protein n=1 Tax=Acorus calamus TaxID=4465 RepID=A0AAV9DMD5_ACOCL|nr:hypothetical protein QJS10_CPB12g00916 [Acorus calamus]
MDEVVTQEPLVSGQVEVTKKVQEDEMVAAALVVNAQERNSQSSNGDTFKGVLNPIGGGESVQERNDVIAVDQVVLALQPVVDSIVVSPLPKMD